MGGVGGSSNAAWSRHISHPIDPFSDRGEARLAVRELRESSADGFSECMLPFTYIMYNIIYTCYVYIYIYNNIIINNNIIIIIYMLIICIYNVYYI